MDIQGYILDHWMNKMSQEHPVLTIYDIDKRYYDLLPLAEKRGIKVIDTTQGILHARISASRFWMRELGEDKDSRMIIYRQMPMPSTERQWVVDPYAAFSKNNAIFPLGPQDEYENICKAFLPNKQKELIDLFSNDAVSFNMVNALLDGAAYPELEELTGGKSFAEITENLLKLPSCESMKWLNEWKTFAEVQYPGLDADGGCLNEIQYKLWSYLLFSEFVFDLPGSLPDNLKSVAVAPPEMKDKVYMICNRLRNLLNLRDTYVRIAIKISEQLNLAELFNAAKHLGNRVTFNFENAVEFNRFVAYLKENNLVEARNLYDKNIKDVWYQQNEEVATFWNLSKYVLELYSTIDKGVNTDGSFKDLVDWYATVGCKADWAFRSFYLVKLNAISLPKQVKELEDLLVKNYHEYIDRGVVTYQQSVVDLVKFPELKNQGCLQEVYPALDRGKRVVFVMVDALRYEMGRTFATSMEHSYPGKVNCEPRVSVLPSVTRFGMANHLADISLKVVDGKLQPLIDGTVIELPADRLNYLKTHLPYQIQDMRLEDMDTTRIKDTTQLLVVRSVYIDTAGENEKLNGLASMSQELKRLARLTDYCRRKNFDMMVFVADHGFMMQPAFRVSDQIERPTGSDICLKESRLLVGNMNESEDTLSYLPQQLGVNADVMKFSYAKKFTVFDRGQVYFHEGLSLQENVVPMITIQLQEETQKKSFSVKLNYRGKNTGTVYMRRPIISLEVFFSDLFEQNVCVRLKVTDEDGNQIGEPSGGYYDDVTELMNIPMNVTGVKQPISINDDFEGEHIVLTALHAETNATLDKITLNFEND